MKRLIVLVTNDVYELPVAVATNCYELSRIIGIKRNTIDSALKRGSPMCMNKYKVYEVEND